MSAPIDALLDKARRSLANARRSLEAGDADFAVSRAYYAMFYAAEAALLSRGRVFSRHSAVVAEFAREFVRAGELAQEYGRALKDAFDARVVADYEASEAFPPARAERLLQRAEAFVAAVAALIAREA